MSDMKKKVYTHRVIFLIGILISALVFSILLSHEKHERRGHFVEACSLQLEKVIEKLLIEEQYLKSLKAFYDGSTHVDETEFHTFIQGILYDSDVEAFLESKEHPIVKIIWAPHIPKIENKTNLNDNQLLPKGFKIKTNNEKTAELKEYFPILYSYPKDPIILGLDLNSINELQLVIKETWHEGTLHTHPGSLTQDPKQPNLILSYPIFKNQFLAITEEKRRKHIKGILIAEIDFA